MFAPTCVQLWNIVFEKAYLSPPEIYYYVAQRPRERGVKATTPFKLNCFALRTHLLFTWQLASSSNTYFIATRCRGVVLGDPMTIEHPDSRTTAERFTPFVEAHTSPFHSDETLSGWCLEVVHLHRVQLSTIHEKVLLLNNDGSRCTRS